MFSPENLKLDADVLNIHLFMADQADRLIGLALTASALSWVRDIEQRNAEICVIWIFAG